MALKFPATRMRRLRRTASLRRLVQEASLTPAHIVAPIFVKAGLKKKEPIAAMPGLFRYSIEEIVKEAAALAQLGIGGLLLFGIPLRKDARGTGAYAPNGIIQQAIKAIKKERPEIVVITDVCLCEYTSNGHCGILRGTEVDNDATLPILAEIALSHAKAGADMVAPSAMMDGQVRALREKLDQADVSHVPIMSYSAKYASALYGPFREAVGSTPQSGDRRGYQMDPACQEEALRETALDIEEGADIVMVKPAMLYLDVIRAVKEKFHWPTAAYQVSGEYSLIKAAAQKGYVDEKKLLMESALSIRRAGADILITYYAKELAQQLVH